MPRSRSFLLIDGRRDPCWQQMVNDVLMPLGTLRVSNEREAVQHILQCDFDLVIIDAIAVENVPLLVSRIRAQCPNARVVVATTSPTWRRAREAFRAGATDYIRKSFDKRETCRVLQATLLKIPPAWPR